MSGDDPERRFPTEADVTRLRTIEVAGRMNKVSADAFAVPPRAGASFRDFVDGLPGILEADSFRAVARG